MRQLPDGSLQVGKGSWIAPGQIYRRHIVASLGNPHGHPLFGGAGPRQTNESKHHQIAGFDRLLQKCQFIPDGIGEHGLKNKALPLPH